MRLKDCGRHTILEVGPYCHKSFEEFTGHELKHKNNRLGCFINIEQLNDVRVSTYSSLNFYFLAKAFLPTLGAVKHLREEKK